MKFSGFDYLLETAFKAEESKAALRSVTPWFKTDIVKLDLFGFQWSSSLLQQAGITTEF
jgi:hypothetical protein